MDSSPVAQVSRLPKLYFLNKLDEFYLVLQHLRKKLVSSHTEKVYECLRIMFWDFVKGSLTWKLSRDVDYMNYTYIMAQSLPSTPSSPLPRFLPRL